MHWHFLWLSAISQVKTFADLYVGFYALYTIYYILYTIYYIPVVPARGGAEVALGLYNKTYVIYRTCARRAPPRPVRACIVRTCCTVVVQEHDLRLTTMQCNTKRHFVPQRSHFTLHTALLALRLRTSHFISSLGQRPRGSAVRFLFFRFNGLAFKVLDFLDFVIIQVSFFGFGPKAAR